MSRIRGLDVFINGPPEAVLTSHAIAVAFYDIVQQTDPVEGFDLDVRLDLTCDEAQFLRNVHRMQRQTSRDRKMMTFGRRCLEISDIIKIVHDAYRNAGIDELLTSARTIVCEIDFHVYSPIFVSAFSGV